MKWWGNDSKSAMQLDCQIPAETDAPLVHKGGGLVGAAPLKSAGIADDAVLGRHLKGMDPILFGIPADGTFVADGTTDGFAFGLGTPAGSTYTMTRDASFRSLTIKSGVTLITNGHRLSAQSLTLVGTAIIHCDGWPGGAADDGVAGSGHGGAGALATAATRVGSIGYRVGIGPGGGVGGYASQSGTSGQDAPVLYPIAGGDGGSGASGGAAGFAGGTGGTKGTNQPPSSLPLGSIVTSLNLWDALQHCGIGGGGCGSSGGGGAASTISGSSAAGGGGGGAGSGGGVVVINVGVLYLQSWTGRISANGGDGGNGGTGATGSGSSTVGNGGIGGPGGGGVVVMIVRRVVGGQILLQADNEPAQIIPGSIGVNGGFKAASGNTSNYAPPTAGRVIYSNLSEDAVYLSEPGLAVPGKVGRHSILNKIRQSQFNPFK